MPKSSKLTAASIIELKTELAAREKRAGALHRRRDELVSQIAALEAEMDLAGVAPNGGTRRARNGKTLPEALAGVLDGKTMSVAEAAVAVQKAGYATISNNFRVSVNLALLNKDRFKRVERGMYTAK